VLIRPMRMPRTGRSSPSRVFLTMGEGCRRASRG
jgi:hypothetical protein